MPNGAAAEFEPSPSALGRLRQHPAGFWFVFSGEAAERASYYGMRTILALYLTEVIGYSRCFRLDERQSGGHPFGGGSPGWR